MSDGYFPLAVDELVQLLKSNLSKVGGIVENWSNDNRFIQVTLSLPQGERYVVLDVDVDLVRVATSNGFRCNEWTTQDTVEEQDEAFGELVSDLKHYLDGDYRIVTRKSFFGRTKSVMIVDRGDHIREMTPQNRVLQDWVRSSKP